MSELALEKMLPQGWIETTLVNLITKISNGPAEKQNKNKTKFPVSRIETISHETIDFNKVRYLDHPLPETIQKYKIEKEDILFSNINSDSHLGKTAIFLDDTLLLHGINLLLIRPDSRIIHPKFLNFIFNYLRKLGFFYSIAQHAVNQSSINQTKIKEIPIQLPPLNEQKRIVEKIEELFSLVDSIEQILIQTKNQLKFSYQSILKFYFDSDYEILKLNDVCDLLSGKAFKKSEYSTEGVRLFQIANVSFGKITWDDIAYLPLEYLKKYPKLELKDGDVIMALNRPIIRRQIKVGMLSPNDVPSILYQRVGKFILFDKIIPKFLFYFLQSSMFIKQLESSLQGIDIPFINKSKLMSFSLPLPTLKEQKIIVQKIEEKFTLVQNTENSNNLLLLKTLLIKNTILKQAFEGKLVPQNPNDEPAEILLQKIKQEKEQLIKKQKIIKEEEK